MNDWGEEKEGAGGAEWFRSSLFVPLSRVPFEVSMSTTHVTYDYPVENLRFNRSLQPPQRRMPGPVSSAPVSPPCPRWSFLQSQAAPIPLLPLHSPLLLKNVHIAYHSPSHQIPRH